MKSPYADFTETCDTNCWSRTTTAFQINKGRKWKTKNYQLFPTKPLGSSLFNALKNGRFLRQRAGSILPNFLFARKKKIFFGCSTKIGISHPLLAVSIEDELRWQYSYIGIGELQSRYLLNLVLGVDTWCVFDADWVC